jgi:hypothetical protein
MRINSKLIIILLIQYIVVVHSALAAKIGNGEISDTSKLVSINDGVLSVDGQSLPIVYGAEIQYFRLRGGAGRNIPRKTVIDLWNKVLDRAVEAGMNAVSVSIPWDFHEYIEGKFDFDGTVDEDGDGSADYPSRDLKTFFRLIDNHNIKIVMIKPGPYIKSEWGFSGMGAVPLWFHEKYPETHMMSSDGLRNKLFDYNDDIFQAHVRLWFETLYREVLSDKIGVGKSIKFVQLDNDSNYAGQNILQVDYSTKSIKRYQNFLKDKYQTINAVNRSQGTNVDGWETIKPPVSIAESRAKLRDWYDYLDFSTSSYLEKLRRIWESLGVDESQILFTSVDSYNAIDFGILPNGLYRNNPAKTGLMTSSLFPKTYYSYEDSLLNYPFKTDFDIKNTNVASQNYLGYLNQWAMASEVEFGWKKNTYVSEPAKKQIYLGALGQGMKAFFVQYFADGWNWQWDWIFKQVQIIKADLRLSDPLTDEQWRQAQIEFEKRQFTGVDLKSFLNSPEKDLSVFNYDGAVDNSGNAKEQFQLLKTIGQRIVRAYGLALSVARPMEDLVSIWRDPTTQAPGQNSDISSAALNSNWSSGLMAMLIHAKVQPSFTMKGVDFTPITKARIIFSIDGGSFDTNTAANALNFLKNGGVWVNFLGVSMLKQLGYNPAVNKINTSNKSISLNYVNIISAAIEVPILNAPIYSYTPPATCRNFLTWKGSVLAFICNIQGGTFIQMGTLMFEDFNTDTYASPSLSQSKKSRMVWLENLLREHQVTSVMKWTSDAQEVSVVSRIWEIEKKAGYWVTLRSAARDTANVKLVFPNIAELIKPDTAADFFQVIEVLSGNIRRVTLKDLKDTGLPMTLSSQGSEALLITPVLK